MYYIPDLSKLLIIADFDGTLTQAHSYDKPTPSLTHILSSQWYLGTDFTTKSKALFDYYRPIEYDHHLSLDFRIQAMEEWWTKSKQLMIDFKLHRDHIRQIACSDVMMLRPGAKEFFDFLIQHHIPLVIMSASGVWVDAISQYLAYNDIHIDTDLAAIISNQCIRDDTWYMVDFVRPQMHSLNKTGRRILQHPHYHLHRSHKTDILLLGDRIHDLDMSSGLPHRCQYSIWRYNHHEDTQLARYQKYFDHVIIDDGPMNDVNKRLQSAIFTM